ncbi:MAG: thioredoxin family protein [Methanocellales archaeon]|nr:thioredoxin family protein [Methanocellales archaeon]MDI6903712.1 thioredoxin family protein [Methanocellales archaeon]
MEKKHIMAFALAVGIVAILGAGYFVAKYKPSPCEITEMTYYYAEWCGACQRVTSEGTISKIEELGVDVTKINVDVGPIEHDFRYIPTFVIDGKIYSGYMTFEQLKELLKCE